MHKCMHSKTVQQMLRGLLDTAFTNTLAFIWRRLSKLGIFMIRVHLCCACTTGLEACKTLQILNASDNMLTCIEAIRHLTNLR